MSSRVRKTLFRLVVAAGPLMAGFALVQAQSANSLIDDTQHMKAVAHVFNQRREHCYAASHCPELDSLMELFAPDAKRTEINRANAVVQLEGAEALRQDSLRVARSFMGRRLQTMGTFVHGRNVVFLQWNWDPGSAVPNPFIHVLRIQEGKIAHWILIAP